jgi:secretory carrier-associated membrane protein
VGGIASGKKGGFVSAFDPPPQAAAPAAAGGPPPSYGGAPSGGNANVEEKERKRKERLAMRQGPAAPNWPRCRPYLYHSIPDEIEVPLQRTVRALYYSWFLVCACSYLNCLGALLILTSGASESGGSDFGWSILYAVLIPVLSFFMWYRPVYNAFKNDSSFYFYVYFIFGGCHVAFNIYIILGST